MNLEYGLYLKIKRVRLNSHDTQNYEGSDPLQLERVCNL